MPNLPTHIDTNTQLSVILDCLEAHNGALPQLNATQTKSTQNFHFLREEHTPSCSLFTKRGIPFVHDFGSGQTYNYISVYAQVYGISTKVAYQEILQKYWFQSADIERDAQRYQKPNTQALQAKKTFSADLAIQISSRFKDFELAYFAQYGISAKLLREYEVYALRSYKKLASSPENPVFAFKLSEDCYKIYQPLSKNKKYKWFWVGEKPTDFLAYGLAQLPEKGDLLFITEGLKDALSIIANTSYTAFALDSASNIPSSTLINSLKNRFNHLIICFDDDETGQKQAQKIAQKYSISYVTPRFSEKSNENTAQTLDFSGADIADFFKKHKLADFDKLPVQSFINQSIQIEQYLTEKSAEKLVFEHFRAGDNLILPAPTGSGKNEIVNRFIADESKKNPAVRFFNGFPNNISAEAKTKEYAKAENNHSKLALEIGLLDQYTSPEERKFIGAFQVINFVYNSFDQISALVGTQDYLFLDEFHKWITQGDIAPLAQINALLESPARKVFLSGTPFESFAKEYEIKSLAIEKAQKSEVKIRMIELTDGDKQSFNQAGKQALYKKAAQYFLTSLAPQEAKLHLLYLNDREALEQLGEYARTLGLEAEVIYSEEDIKRNSKAWKCLTEAKPVPLSKDKGKVLLMTSLVYDSLNLNNPAEEIGKFAIFGEIFTQNVRQALHRPRKAKNLEVLYFVAAHKERDDFQESYEQYRQKWFKDYEQIKTQLEQYSPIELLAMPEKQRETLLHDASKVITEDLKFNKLACLISYEQQKARRESNAQKRAILAQYHPTSLERIEVNEVLAAVAAPNESAKVHSQQIVFQPAEMTPELATDGVEEVRKLMTENHVFTLAYYSQTRLENTFKVKLKEYIGRNFDFNDLDYLQFKQKIKLSHAGTRALRKYAARFIKWANYFANEQAILEIIFSKKYKAIAQQFSVAHLLAKSEKTMSEQVNLSYYQAVIQHFEIGESYTRSQRETIIKEVYQTLQHLQYSEDIRQQLFKALFITREDRSDKNQRKLQIMAVVNLEILCEMYHLRILPNSFTDKKEGLNIRNIEIDNPFFVGDEVVEACPF